MTLSGPLARTRKCAHKIRPKNCAEIRSAQHSAEKLCTDSKRPKLRNKELHRAPMRLRKMILLASTILWTILVWLAVGYAIAHATPISAIAPCPKTTIGPPARSRGAYLMGGGESRYGDPLCSPPGLARRQPGTKTGASSHGSGIVASPSSCNSRPSRSHDIRNRPL